MLLYRTLMCVGSVVMSAGIIGLTDHARGRRFLLMNTDHAAVTLADATAFTEDQAREYLEAICWPSGPVCPHCGSLRATRLQGGSTAPGTLKCKDCRTKFTVRVGSILEDSPIPLRKWVIAFHLLCS